MTRNRLAALALGLAVVLGLGTLTACGPTLQSIPLPGTGVSGKTMSVTMEFADALNLAQGAPVKVNGVDEGKVESIAVRDFHAQASLKVKDDAELRQGLKATLRYTTPLGELYVDITNPRTGPLLTDGAHVGMNATETAPTVEDALSEASLLINGGGLASLQTITDELNKALGGRTGVWRDLLKQSDTFLTTANATTRDIDSALNALSDVSATLSSRRSTINRALKELAPAARTLRKATPNFTRLLTAVQRFARQANRTVGATRSNLLTTITEVEPVLATLASTRGTFDHSLRQLQALGEALKRIIPGDYLNVYLTLDLNQSLLGGVGPGTSPSGKPSSKPSSGGGGGLLGGLLPSAGSSGGVCLLGVCLDAPTTPKGGR